MRTDNSSVQDSPKIIFAKGIKQVRSVFNDIRIFFFVNAIGIHVRPVLIFPKVHFKNYILSGASTGKIGGVNPTGLSNLKFVFDYLKYFIACEMPGKKDPVYLILDNHEFLLSTPAIIVAKENGISKLTLPPHTSHK